jgi:hypothetical protein
MVRVTDQDVAPPLPTLDYAPPARPVRRLDAFWGILISVFLANGVGWMVFGALMMAGYRDDNAGPFAVGAASIALAAGLAGTFYVTRRFPSSPR